MNNRTIPGLNFSIMDDKFEKLWLLYLGKNTRGTYLFFDPINGTVYKWNEGSGLLRRNSDSTGDGRNSLCSPNPIAMPDLLDKLTHYVTAYRRNCPRLRRLTYEQYHNAKNAGIVR